jgi:hypothetical protein
MDTYSRPRTTFYASADEKYADERNDLRPAG